jgi:hypothetical protein
MLGAHSNLQIEGEVTIKGLGTACRNEDAIHLSMPTGYRDWEVICLSAFCANETMRQTNNTAVFAEDLGVGGRVSTPPSWNLLLYA